MSVLESQSFDFTKQTLVASGLLPHLIISDNSAPLATRERDVLASVHQMILRTDMSHHFDLLQILLQISEEQSHLMQKYDHVDSSLVDLRTVAHSPEGCILDSQGRQNLLNIVLHAADISNPTRPYQHCKYWADCIGKEFDSQTKQRQPLAQQPSQASTQLQFTDIIVKPYFDAFSEIFPRIVNVTDMLLENTRKWHLIVDIEEKSQVNLSRSRSTTMNISTGEKKVQQRQYLSLGDVDLNQNCAPGPFVIPDHVYKVLQTLENTTDQPADISIAIRRISLANAHGHGSIGGVRVPLVIQEESEDQVETVIGNLVDSPDNHLI